MIAFDTEDNSKGFVYMINFYDGIKHYTFHHTQYSNQIELKKQAVSFILNSGDKLFVAHNLEYDIINVFFPASIKLLNLYYSGRLIYAKLNNTHIKFIDSFNFTFTSLKNIAVEVEMEKLETDNFDNIEYCRIDTEIVYKFMDRFSGFVKDKFNMKIRTTLAGTSQKIFLEHFCKEKITGKNTDEVLLNSYYGGRCELFLTGEIDNYVFEVDVNSMYPYVMEHFNYPLTEAIKTDEPAGECFITCAEIETNKIDIPLIPCRRDLLFFPRGKFITWFTSAELESANKNKQIKSIRFIETYNFIRTGIIFKDFVDYFYEMRFKAKEESNSFLSNFYKRVLNSVYGRFALKSNMQIISANVYNYELRKELDNGMFDYINHGIKKNINYALPIFITAYSRIILFKLLTKIKKIGAIPIYCDTDSVYFTYDKKINLQDKIIELYNQLPISNNLGDLSLEVYKGGSFYNNKAYLLETFDLNTKFTCKGIPEKHRQEFMQDGSTTYVRPMKLRPSFRGVKGIAPNVWYDFYIENKGTYKKRLVKKDFGTYQTTKPLIF